MRLQIAHRTRYDYSPAVETAQHLACLQPLELPHQRLRFHELEIIPKPAQRAQRIDVHGNHRCHFTLQTPHHSLDVLARSLVDTSAPGRPGSVMGWEAVRDHYTYRAGAPYDPASTWVFASPFVTLDPALADYALPSFPPGRSLLEAASDLTHRLHADMRYDSQSTQIHTPAPQALAQRRGVCQDFAHILVGCLRSLGLAARYVSGYLLTQPAAGAVRLVGSDASHAWASVYLPDLPAGARWLDLDPTNDRIGWPSPGEDYVTLALGRDFGDVSPMRGVILGGARHHLTVGVAVEPLMSSLSSVEQPSPVP